MRFFGLLAGSCMIRLVHGDDSSTAPDSTITTSANSTGYTVFAPTNTPTFNLDAQVTFKWQENGGNGWGGVYCDTPGFNDNIYFPNSSAKTTTGTTTWSISGSGLPINNNKNWPLTCSFVMWWDTGRSARPLGYPSSTGGGTFVLEDLITITNAEQTTPTSWVIQTATVFPSKTPEPTPSSGSTFPEPTAPSVSGNGLSTGEKAGIAVGAVAGSALVAGVIYWIMRMQRNLAVQNERLSWIEDANSVGPGKPAFSVGSPTQETATSTVGEQSTAHHEMNVPDAIVEIGEMDSQQRHDGPHEMPEK